MICCGQERQSRYCPDCGATLARTPLDQLCFHLRKTIKQVEASIERFKVFKDRGGDEDDYFQRRIVSLTERRDRWQSWLGALKELTGKG